MPDREAPPRAQDAPFAASYALLSERVRRQYLGYYKLVFDDGVLDLKTKEMVALGASLMSGAAGCIEGHLKKLVELGATRAEVEEVVAVTAGVAAASAVDRADAANAALDSQLDALFARNAGGEA